MCKIKHWFNDWGTGKTKKKKAAQARLQKAKQEEEAAAKRAVGYTEQETATAAQTNRSEDRTINSLRVPLSTNGTGGNTGYNNRFGLNLL